MNCKLLFKMGRSKPGIAFFVLLLCLWIEPAEAQSPYLLPEVFPNAPNTAELAKHGDYSVNLFTGLPDISIPLYEIKAGDLNVPITLSYHASGIKVSDVASMVGLGWSLNAGGVINRKIKGGKADENLSEEGYMAGNLQKIMNFTEEEEDLKLDYYDRVRKSFIDVEPDIFSYSFPGHSGKFFFNGMDDYRPVLIPYSPINLQHTLTNEQLSFNIQDENGNQYLFGNNYKESVTNNQGNYSVTAWKLEEIISQKGQDNIQFTYTKSSFTSPTTYSNAWVVDDLVEIYHSEAPTYSSNPQAGSVESSHYSSINEQQLSEILFEDGKIVFISETDREDIGAKRLDQIEIYNYDHNAQQYYLQKTVKFDYGYFNTDDVYSTKRLKLNAVEMLDKSGNPVERYSFDYNTDGMLPYPGSKAVDYWGYYNGKENDMLIPQEDVNFEESGSTRIETIGSQIADGRESDPDFNQACILKRIHYPTGGYTDFEYESNRYIDENGGAKLGGGLRIKSIKSYDGLNVTPLEKQYEYGDGRSNFVFGSYSFRTTQTYRYFHVNKTTGAYVHDETKRSRTYVSNPTVDVVPFDAAAVVYPEVTEYYGSSDKNSGKTIYRFRDHVDMINIRSTSNNNKPIKDSYFYARGQLKEKEHHRLRSNGNYNIVSKETFSYSVFPQTIHENVGLVVDKHTINQMEGGGGDVLILPGSGMEPDDSNSFGINYYSINTDDNYLKSKTIRRYDQEDETKYTSQTTEYVYDNIAHQQVTKEKTQDSKGRIHEKRMKYPADYIDGGSSTNNLLLDAMLSKNMHAVPIEEQSTQTIGTSTLTTAAQLNLYKQLPLGSIVLGNHQRLEIEEPTATFEPISIVSGELQADTRYGNVISFDAYDDKDNLVQYTARNSSPVTIVWGYDQLYPIAEVKNAQNTLTLDPSSQTTSTKDVIITSNSTTTDLYTIDFTVQRSGDGEIKSNFHNAPDLDDTGTIICSVSGPNGFLQENIKVCITSSSGCGSIPSSVLLSFSDTGDYTLTAKLENNTNIDTDIRLIFDYPTAELTGVKEFFFENFEESGVEGQAHTGTKFHNGNYTVEFELPNTRSYLLSYWYREGGEWKQIEEAYTGPNQTLTLGDGIDDVRIHPNDAQMTTYTYEPLIGITSSIDPAGITTYYVYDQFGRLKYLKDHSGHILKKNEYHLISK